nr:uncharacterized protein LOC111996000 [Quercus suber]
MDEVTSTETSPSSNQEVPNDESPLWQYVTKVEIPPSASIKSGGNTYYKCNYCSIDNMGSYSRVKAHLLQISGKERERRSQIPLPSPPLGRGPAIPISPFRRQEGSDSTNPVDAKRRNSPLEKAFQNNARHDLDSKIARIFYTGGLPFNFARNPHYCSSYAYAAIHKISGYLPPGYNALRTTLLQKERAHVERILKPIKNSWLENGVSIVSDGWSNPQRRLLINIMAVSDGGPVFIKVIDGSGEFKDKHYIAGVLKDAIKEIGHEKVVQVITDNASVMKSSRALIEVSDTRFASVVVMLKRMKLIKRCLQAMTISNQWASYREDDVGKAQMVKDMIPSNLWWDNIDYILEFTTPIYDMLRIADTDKPCFHLVYEIWDSMIEKVKTYIGMKAWKMIRNPKRIPPHQDHEISMERCKCLERYFEDENELMVVKFEFATFSRGRFPSADALTDRCNDEYIRTTTKMWEIVGDSWNESNIYGGVGILENAALTFDEPELEAMVIRNANTSSTASESEVRSEAIDIEDDDVGV